MLSDKQIAEIREHMKGYVVIGSDTPNKCIAIANGTFELKRDLPNAQYWQIRRTLTHFGLWTKEIANSLIY